MMVEQQWKSFKLKHLVRDISYPIGDGDHGQIKPSSYTQYGIPYIRVGDMGWGELRTEDMVFIPEDIHLANLKSRLIPGDILLAKTGATLGKCCIVPDNIIEANTTSSVGKISIDPDIVLPKWILYYFLTRKFQDFLWSISSRTAQPGFNIRDIKEFDIPVAPMDTQIQIVETLDAILPRVRQAKSRLEKFTMLLKRLRQSVLSAACSGKLTEEWRSDQQGTTDYAINKSTTSLRDIEGEIPEEWSITAFTDVCQIASNLVNPSDYQDHPHIAPDNIEKESGKLLSFRTIAEDRVRSPKHLFYAGQIIYSKIRPYLSKAILADFDGLCSADMYPLASKINSQFLLYYILSPQFVKLASTAGERSVLPKINQNELSNIPVPVPSIEEQEEIVTRVQMLMRLIDSIVTKYHDSKARIENVEQSILSRIFNVND